MLPSGPQWHCKPWTTAVATKMPVKLFYHDTINCLKSLYGHLLLKYCIKHTLLHVFLDAQKLVHVYSEWPTGDVAWETQVSTLNYLPPLSSCVLMLFF